MTTADLALRVTGLDAGYGRLRILHDISLEVQPGETVAVLGANGAGKTTLLRTISGLTRVHTGSINVYGVDCRGRSPRQVCHLGVAHVPENRHVFPRFSVDENLNLATIGLSRRDRSLTAAKDVAEVYDHFPELERRRRQRAGTLSGGEQQMLAIGMALMAHPRLLMLDEPSLGLAPIVVSRVFQVIERLKQAGSTILVVEQMVQLALGVADRAYILALGRVVNSGRAIDLQSDLDSLGAAYLG